MHARQQNWPTYPYHVCRTGDDKFHVENLQALDPEVYPKRDTYAEANGDAVALKAARVHYAEVNGKEPAVKLDLDLARQYAAFVTARDASQLDRPQVQAISA